MSEVLRLNTTCFNQTNFIFITQNLLKKNENLTKSRFCFTVNCLMIFIKSDQFYLYNSKLTKEDLKLSQVSPTQSTSPTCYGSGCGISWWRCRKVPWSPCQLFCCTPDRSWTPPQGCNSGMDSSLSIFIIYNSKWSILIQWIRVMIVIWQSELVNTKKSISCL